MCKSGIVAAMVLACCFTGPSPASPSAPAQADSCPDGAACRSEGSDADVLLGRILVFDISPATEKPLVGFPRRTAATTVQGIREETAARAGVPVGTVHLKNYAFRAQAFPIVGMGRQGTLLAKNNGYQLRTSWDELHSQQTIRVCDFDETKEPKLRAELIVGLDETVLVPIGMGTRRAILAVHSQVVPESEWVKGAHRIQTQFFTDAEAHVVEPRWESREVETRRDCESEPRSQRAEARGY